MRRCSAPAADTPNRRCASGAHALRRLRELTRRINALETEIGQLVAQIAPQLLAEPGFGPLTAAKLVGAMAGVERFKTDAKLARAAGVAPIPASSGNSNRHRLDPGGNRQINAALHCHARPLPPRDPELPQAQEVRSHDHPRSDPMPQTLPRPPHLAPPPGHPARSRTSPPRQFLDIDGMCRPGSVLGRV